MSESGALGRTRTHVLVAGHTVQNLLKMETVPLQVKGELSNFSNVPGLSDARVCFIDQQH